MNKYIIRNCPAHFFDEINGKPKCWQKWEQFDESCQNCTDCLLKQIYETCKDNALIGGIDETAEKVVDLLDIQEVE